MKKGTEWELIKVGQTTSPMGHIHYLTGSLPRNSRRWRMCVRVCMRACTRVPVCVCMHPCACVYVTHTVRMCVCPCAYTYV